MNHQSKVRRAVLLAVLVIGAAIPPVMAGADGPALTVTDGSRISVDVNNEPLNALLRMMAEKRLFNMNGGVAGDEALTLHFSNVTLQEILPKMLRGYNYVLMGQGKNQVPVLAVMGKIEKGAVAAHADAPAPAAALPEPRSYAPPAPMPAPPAPQARLQQGLPPRQPVAQPVTPQVAQAAGQAGRQTGQQAPAIQPGQPAVQMQAGQQAPGGQPAPVAEAPPESPGVHF